MSRRAASYAGLFLCNALWGLSFIGTRYALSCGLDPMSLAFFRYLAVTPMLFAVERRVVKDRRVKRRDWFHLFASAVFGVTLYYYFENTGMLYTTASNASLIIASVPVLTLLADALFFRAHIRKTQWAGVALSVAGVALVVGGDFDFSSATLLGNLLIFGGCLVWVAYVFASRRLLREYDSVLVTSRQSLIALATLLPFGLFASGGWPAFSWPLAAVVVALGLLCSGACYLWYVDAIKTLGTVVVSVFLNFVPVVAVASGAIFLGERLTHLQMAGGAIILLGITLVTLPSRRALSSGATA